jgi:hypothetical protein
MVVAMPTSMLDSKITARALVVAASLTTSVAANAEAKTLYFSGQWWEVKDSAGGKVGPGPNRFSENNAWVDAEGRLHLRIQKDKDGVYSSAEVILPQSLGHGTYRFRIGSPVFDLDPVAVLGLFTWSNLPAEHHREIDMEITRWGRAKGPCLHYAVQPYTAPGHEAAFFAEDTVARSIHALTWRPGGVDFDSLARFDDGATEAIAAWTYAGADVPSPGDANPRINLWLYDGRKPSGGGTIEVIVDGFEFVPL